MHHDFLRLAVALSFVALTGCQQQSAAPTPAPAPAQEASPLQTTTTVQDLMTSLVDPSADFLWASVSTLVTAAGTEERQPRTDAEWHEVRRHAIILTEAGNLLALAGRKVAPPGKKLEDEGIQGVLPAAEVQALMDSNHAAFAGFAQALRDVGADMVKAIDARNPQGMIDAGEAIDEVCESCHMTFWYPNQKIPPFPDQAPE